MDGDMKIETLSDSEMNSIKGGIWVELESGEWIWIED